jgi:radical SAM protein with 4Fe4S-binding SPASM domain
MDSKNKILKIRWQVRFSKCNLKCPYCIAEWTKRKVEFNPELFFKGIDVIKSLNQKVVLRIGVEGEFFLSKDLKKGVIDLSSSENVMGVSFSSNLQSDWKEMEQFFAEVNLKKLGMGCTLHDTVIKSVDDFFDKVKKINDLGVLIYVGYVAIPDRFKKIEEYKKRLDEIGVPFILNELNGEYNGKMYPYSYTESEREFLKNNFFSYHYYRMLVERDSPEGKACGAGEDYIYIDHKGDIYKCGVDKNPEWKIYEKIAYKLNKNFGESLVKKRIQKSKIGNICDCFPKLDSTYRVCPHKVCACGNEVQAMKCVDINFYRTRTLRIIYPKLGSDECERKFKNLKRLDDNNTDHA